MTAPVFRGEQGFQFAAYYLVPNHDRRYSALRLANGHAQIGERRGSGASLEAEADGPIALCE